MSGSVRNIQTHTNQSIGSDQISRICTQPHVACAVVCPLQRHVYMNRWTEREKHAPSSAARIAERGFRTRLGCLVFDHPPGSERTLAGPANLAFSPSHHHDPTTSDPSFLFAPIDRLSHVGFNPSARRRRELDLITHRRITHLAFPVLSLPSAPYRTAPRLTPHVEYLVLDCGSRTRQRSEGRLHLRRNAHWMRWSS